jgi:hypothetical protein
LKTNSFQPASQAKSVPHVVATTKVVKAAETVVEIGARAAIEEIAATGAHVVAETEVVAAETVEAAAAIVAGVVDDRQGRR